jgi:hypothetical protein
MSNEVLQWAAILVLFYYVMVLCVDVARIYLAVTLAKIEESPATPRRVFTEAEILALVDLRMEDKLAASCFAYPD